MRSTWSARGVRGRHVEELLLVVPIAVLAGISWIQLAEGAAMASAMSSSDAGLFFAMWLWMVGAMMLPSTAPMVVTCHALLADRAAHARTVGVLLFIAPYIFLWFAAGLVALAVRLFSDVHPAVPAGLVAVAGLYQLSPLKERCLGHCRSPLGFFLQHGPALDSAVGTLMLGVRHAGFCLACCAGLMLALTALAAFGLSWMAAIALLVLLEKWHAFGRSISRAAGAVFIAAAPIRFFIPVDSQIWNWSGLGLMVALGLVALTGPLLSHSRRAIGTQ